MKKIGFKKVILGFFLFLGIFGFLGYYFHSSAALVAVNFSAKLQSESDSNYRTSVGSVSLNTNMVFKFVSVYTSTTTYNGSISLNGFQKSGTNLSYTLNYPANCFFSQTTYSDAGATFAFSGDGTKTCSVTVYSYYKPITVGSKSVTTSVDSVLKGTVTLTATSDILLNSAYTRDYDSDGYIDAYSLGFSTGFDTSNLSLAAYSVSLGGQNASSLAFSGNSGTKSSVDLTFADNVWNGGDIPDVILSGYTSGGYVFSNVGVNDLIESDYSKPVLKSLNSTTIIDSNGSFVNGVVSMSANDNVVLNFSETLNPSSTGHISLKYSDNTILTGVWSVSSNQFTFNPNYDLSTGVSIIIGTGVKDLSANGGNSVEYTVVEITVADGSAPVGQSIGSNTGVQIAGGQSSTTNRYVTLTLGATDNNSVSQMMISNYSDFSGGSWQTYATSLSNWGLLVGSGTKTVYVKFKDNAGNVSSTYSDDIYLDYSSDYINLTSSVSTYVSGSTISLQGSCSYNTGATSLTLQYSVNSGSYVDWVSCNNTSKTWSGSLSSFTLNSLDSVQVRFKDYTSVYTNFSFTHDNTSPTGTLTITGSYQTYGAYKLTSNTAINLYLNGSDTNGVSRVHLSGDMLDAFKGYHAYTNNKAISLTSTSGLKNICSAFDDNAGNISTYSCDNIILDVTNPTGSISINGGNSYISGTSVTLTLSASDTYGITDMMISNYSDFTGASWETYATSKAWTVLTGDGTKTVYVKFKDTAGNSSSSYNDTIILDTQTSDTSATPASGSYQNGNPISVSLSCLDNGASGCYRTYYRVGASGGFTQYSSAFSVNGTSESKVVYYYSIDNAGNVESTQNITYTFNSSYLNIQSSVQSYTSGSSLALNGTCRNLSGSNSIEYSINSGLWTGGISCSSNTWSTTIGLLSNTGNNITLRFVDNISASTTASITTDTVSPIASFSINGGNSYASNSGLSLSITGVDTNGFAYMYISGDISTNIYTGYQSTYTVYLSGTDGVKTIYVALVDNAGNLGNAISRTINYETVPPVVTVLPTGGNYSGVVTVTMAINETGTIYYSFDPNVDLETAGSVYTGSFTVNSNKSLSFLGKDTAGNKTSKQTYIYNFVCDSGYTWNGSVCAANPPAGGGGGGGGGGGTFTPVTTTTTNTTNTNTNQTTNSNTTTTVTLNNIDITSVAQSIKNNVSENYYPLVEKLSTTFNNQTTDYRNKAGLSDVIFNLQVQYSNAFQNLVVNAIKYAETKDETFKSNALNYLNQYTSFGNSIKSTVSSYVTTVNTVYKPVDTNLQKATNVLENMIVSKVNSLKSNGQIIDSEYTEFNNAYNNFVYGVVVYKKENSSKAKQFAADQIKTIIKYYNIKLQESNTQVEQNNEQPVQKVYTKDMIKNAKSNEIRTLQNFLISKGYWDNKYTATGIFGDVTLKYAKSYLSQVYGITLDGTKIDVDTLNQYFIQ